MIGIIWYKYHADGEFMANEIIKQYNRMGYKIIYSIGDSYCHNISWRFNNEDIWYCLSASGSSKGLACNIAYIDNNIDKDYVQQVILPMVKRYPYNGVHYYN